MIIGIAIGMRILVKIWNVLAPNERASAILARSTRRKPVAELIITIGPRGERDRNDARLAAETEAQDQQRHERQHRRRHQQQNIGRDDLLDEGELSDDRRHDEADRAADRETDEQLVERHQQDAAR